MPERFAVWRRLGSQARINFWLIMSILALSAAVIYLGYQGRIELWQQNIDNCNSVTVPGALAAASRDNDLSLFASTAAEARRASGQYSVAKKYDQISDRAANRHDASIIRAAIPCSSRFPKPAVFSNGEDTSVTDSNSQERR